MLINYLKIALRNIVKTRIFTTINILGLAIGMAACLLILHYVLYEKSYDRFHENSERIYRLRYERTDGQGESVRFASCCPPAAARIRDKYPEVEKIGRIVRYRAAVSYRDMNFMEERMYFAEPDFLEILKFKFIEGNPLTGIRDPNTAFISQSTAQKYFGNENPIGKTVSLDKKTDYLITGIFEDIPQNSHLKFDILLPWENLVSLYGPEYTEAWGHTGSYTYLIVKPGTDPKEFEGKLKKLAEAECPWLKEYKMTIDLKMQPLSDIHLNSHFMQEYEVNGRRDTVNFLFIIALFIMVMAWVNYVNLSTARSLDRAKEVGLRKVVGASRRQLMSQFFFETILLNLAALIVATGLVEFFLPLFSVVTGIPTDYGFMIHSWFWIAVSIMFLAGILFSGLYPVIVLSSFRPAVVLKGKLRNSASGINLRKALVVFQFVVALGLIAGTITMSEQLSFMKNQDLGFNIEQTLVVQAPRVRDDAYGEKFKLFKETILANPNILKACHVTEVPGRQIYWDAGGIHKAGEDISKGKNYQIVGIDYDFVNVFDIKLAAGRNFSREFSTDSKSLLLNETAVKWMGFNNSQEAIGQKVDYWEEIFTIVGVVKDYHQQSPKAAFEPHLYRLLPTGRGVRGQFAIKLNSSNLSQTIKLIHQRYDEFFPGNPFNYFFLDEYFNQQYQSDFLLGKVFSLFAGLALFITALGIFGLSAFNATQRTKEIGIRKAVGASVLQVFQLLVKELFVLLLISFAIALPILIIGLNKWLESYANRMSLNFWLFLIPLIITAGITFLTISWQTIKSAATNPVEALRYE